MYLYGFPSNDHCTYAYLQEAVIKKKYGGILPRKTPLISKVHIIALRQCFSCLFELCNIFSYTNVANLCLFTIWIWSKIETPYQDHERAYFDSADWALGKVIFFPPKGLIEFGINYSKKCETCYLLLLFQQGGVPNKPKGPLEALRPKLQVAISPHQMHNSLFSSTMRCMVEKAPGFFIVNRCRSISCLLKC